MTGVEHTLRHLQPVVRTQCHAVIRSHRAAGTVVMTRRKERMQPMGVRSPAPGCRSRRRTVTAGGTRVRWFTASVVLGIGLATVLSSPGIALAHESRGRITITATGAQAAGTGTRTGAGTSAIYDYCEDFPVGNSPILLQGRSRTFRLDISPGPTSGCGSGFTVPDYTWQVRWARGSMVGDSLISCYNDGFGPYIVLGTVTTSNGSGTGDYVLPQDGIGPGNICVEQDPNNPLPFPHSNVALPMLLINYTLTI